MRATKQLVIEAACEIADESGMSAVSLKAVAQRLGIRPPSLYNHVDDLESLLHGAAQAGMSEMNRRMTSAAVGVAGESAITAVAEQYAGYMVQHPGVYEISQWATWHNDEKTAELFREYFSLISALVEKIGCSESDLGEVTDIITGFLHGYCTMRLRYAITDTDGEKIRLKGALSAVMMGIRQKYGIE